MERVFCVDERRSAGGLRVTDDFSRLLQSSEGNVLASEAEARWRLVETAWELGMARHSVTIHADPGVDALFVLKSKARRAAVTTCRSALNGYQKGRCFYCYRPIVASATTDVDHFFPHVLKQLGLLAALDGVWNLVLACRDCNRGERGKFARVPSQRLLERLWDRNEFRIASHHPLRKTLLQQTGLRAADRRSYLSSCYQRALGLLIHTWQPASEAADPYASPYNGMNNP